jgi:hypothetical protein
MRSSKQFSQEVNAMEIKTQELTLMEYCKQEPYCLETLLEPLTEPEPSEQSEIYIALQRLYQDGLTDVAYLVACALSKFGIGKKIYNEIIYEALNTTWGQEAQVRFIEVFLEKYKMLNDH